MSDIMVLSPVIDEFGGLRVQGCRACKGVWGSGFKVLNVIKFLLAQFRFRGACRGILEGAYRFHLVQPPSMDWFPDGA